MNKQVEEMMSGPDRQSSPWTILHGGALGDLVLTLQLFEQIKLVEPHASPTTVISRVDLSGCFPPEKIYEFVNIDAVDLHKLFADAPSEISPGLRQLLTHRNILNTLTVTNSQLHHNLVNLSMGGRGSRRAVASKTHDSPNSNIQANKIISLETRISPACASHVLLQWRDQLSNHQLNFKTTLPAPPIKSTSTPRVTATINGEALHNQKFLLHPGSGGRAKCWPIASFTALARQLTNCGAQPRFILGPVERETLTDDQRAELASAAPVIESNTLREFATEFQHANAYIGNDAGGTHLAAYHSIPTLALFGPTRASVWHPLGPRVCCMQGDAAAKNWNIDTEMVIAEVIGLLLRKPVARNTY